MPTIPADRLLWSSYEAPLRRFSMLRPLPDIRGCRLARWYHPARHVPPARFLTVSAVCSAASPAGLFRPASAMGFTTFQASPCTHRRSDGARLTIPVVHEPFKVFPRRQPFRVTTAVSTLPFHPASLESGSAPSPGYVPACTGKLEPTEMGLHVPAAPWSAAAADESATLQVCGYSPWSEDQTHAVARSLD